jgi:hypothetical protein
MKQTYLYNNHNNNIIIVIVVLMTLVTSCSNDSGGGNGGRGSSEGKGGSMARFSIVGDLLFTVDQDKLKTFDISNSKDPVFYTSRTQDLEFGIETIFPMDSLLFIGSQTGMYIFRVSNRGFLQHLSKTSHIRSCDPVVAQDNYAYVTLNSNNVSCGRTTNLLQIYDITDRTNPKHLRNVEGFSSPMGLGIDGDKLFVCNKGVTVFDITDRTSPDPIADLNSAGLSDVVDAYDVIPLNGLLIVVSSTGIYQLNYTDTDELTLVSKIEIKR